MLESLRNPKYATKKIALYTWPEENFSHALTRSSRMGMVKLAL